MPDDTPRDLTRRCRLVAIVSAQQLEAAKGQFGPLLDAALSGGDIASVIFAQGSLEDAPFIDHAEPLVAITRAAGVPSIIAGSARAMTRMGADGIQFSQDAEAVHDAVQRLSPKFMVGAGNIRTRHTALVIGEAQPDYVFFGKAGDDTRPQPKAKNLDLGEWWASIIEIPCIVLGGTAVDCVVQIAEAGVEFVALSNAIFMPDGDGIDGLADAAHCRDIVTRANQLLDDHAPEFEDPDAA